MIWNRSDTQIQSGDSWDNLRSLRLFQHFRGGRCLSLARGGFFDERAGLLVEIAQNTLGGVSINHASTLAPPTCIARSVGSILEGRILRDSRSDGRSCDSLGRLGHAHHVLHLA